MEGSFSAAPDCIAPHIYKTTEEKLKSSVAQLSLNRCETVSVKNVKFPWMTFTSLATSSSTAFLSVFLKASRVLVLYSVPIAGQQRAGVGPSLVEKGKAALS